MATAQKPARLRILIPGFPQWTWRQPERAAALGGTYAAAMAMALFAWGSKAGLAMLGLAFLAHVVSAADAIKQSAFPGFGRWVPTTSAGFGLGLGCYGPGLVVAAALAWPQAPSGAEHDRYAINLWAYRNAEPEPGDWVWYRSPGGGYGLGQVVAGPGRAVEWTPGGLTVDGRALGWKPKSPGGAPLDLAMTVPESEFLVAPGIFGGTSTSSSCGLRLVPREGVMGRPWARLYPIWRRGLLL